MTIPKKRLPNQWQICPKFNKQFCSAHLFGQSWRSIPSKHSLGIIPVTLIVLLFVHTFSFAQILEQGNIHNGGYIIARNGNIIEEYNADKQFIPASTIKLLTAVAALETLGSNYRFVTQFYIDTNNTLYVSGGGDPMLTSEVIAAIVSELYNRGIRSINSYVLDDSSFQLEHSRPDGSINSDNPYDVGNGGLVANFNSIVIRKNADGTVLSGEKQTPTTIIAEEIGKNLLPGNHRINIEAYPVNGQTSPSLRYMAELLHTMFQKLGVHSRLEIRKAQVPANLQVFYRYRSEKTVEEIVRLCLLYSNNFIANQLALVAGSSKYGPPATWNKARKLLEHFAYNEIGIVTKDLQVTEGSGLSRNTLATPTAMLKILQSFEPYRDLLPLKKGTRLKSGTLDGVYCYAGYLDSRNGTVLYSFLLNQKENTRNILLSDIRKYFNNQ